jgi:PAS domain S-box-containing protein
MIVENSALIKELYSEENYLSSVLDLVDIIIIITDKNNVIRLINKKGYSLLGSVKEEIVDTNLEDIIPDSNQNYFINLWEKQFKKGIDSNENYEIPVLTDNGEERLWKWHNVLLKDEKGEVVFIMSSCEDITENKWLEKREQVRDDVINKLTKMNESKDSLFSLIAHDLRSPFNSLLGFSEILNSEYDTLTSTEIKDYLNVIYETSKNLYGMTNNLLHFSRFQIGRIEYNPVELDFKKMIDRVLLLLKGNSVKKQINIVVDISVDIKVFADEDMVNSILQNLISNAVKFTNKGGNIHLSAIQYSDPDGKPMIEVSVNDDGIGIEDGLKEKLFKEHVPSSNGTNKEIGTGLGLLLAKEFVEQNGGKIIVLSKVKGGSTFTFTLPAA